MTAVRESLRLNDTRQQILNQDQIMTTHVVSEMAKITQCEATLTLCQTGEEDVVSDVHYFEGKHHMT